MQFSVAIFDVHACSYYIDMFSCKAWSSYVMNKSCEFTICHFCRARDRCKICYLAAAQ